MSNSNYVVPVYSTRQELQELKADIKALKLTAFLTALIVSFGLLAGYISLSRTMRNLSEATRRHE